MVDPEPTAPPKEATSSSAPRADVTTYAARSASTRSTAPSAIRARTRGRVGSAATSTDRSWSIWRRLARRSCASLHPRERPKDVDGDGDGAGSEGRRQQVLRHLAICPVLQEVEGDLHHHDGRAGKHHDHHADPLLAERGGDQAGECNEGGSGEKDERDSDQIRGAHPSDPARGEECADGRERGPDQDQADQDGGTGGCAGISDVPPSHAPSSLRPG